MWNFLNKKGNQQLREIRKTDPLEMASLIDFILERSVVYY